MTPSITLLTEFVAERVENPSRLPLSENSQLSISLLDDLIKSATQHILYDNLPEDEELWLMDLLDALQIEKERIDGRTKKLKEEDPLLGWYLHQRSQSGFELPPSPPPQA